MKKLSLLVAILSFFCMSCFAQRPLTDSYGGIYTVKGTATGYYHVQKLVGTDGKNHWVMIDPLGYGTIERSISNFRYSGYGTDQNNKQWSDYIATKYANAGTLFPGDSFGSGQSTNRWSYFTRDLVKSLGFNGADTFAFTSVPFYQSNQIAICSVSESGTTVTATLCSAITSTFTAGAQIIVSGVLVSGYNCTCTISTASGTTVTYTAGTSGLANSSNGFMAAPQTFTDIALGGLPRNEISYEITGALARQPLTSNVQNIYASIFSTVGSSPYFPDVFNPQWAIDVAAELNDGTTWDSDANVLAFFEDQEDQMRGLETSHPHLGFMCAAGAPYLAYDPNGFSIHGGSNLNITYSDAKNYCKAALVTYLQGVYGTIGALNTSWGTSFTTWGTSGHAWTGQLLYDTSTGLLAAGNGSTLTYPAIYPIPQQPLVTGGTVVVHYVEGGVAKTLTDSASGNGTFATNADLASGSMNLSSTQVSLTFNSGHAPDAGCTISSTANSISIGATTGSITCTAAPPSWIASGTILGVSGVTFDSPGGVNSSAFNALTYTVTSVSSDTINVNISGSTVCTYDGGCPWNGHGGTANQTFSVDYTGGYWGNPGSEHGTGFLDENSNDLGSDWDTSYANDTTPHPLGATTAKTTCGPGANQNCMFYDLDQFAVTLMRTWFSTIRTDQLATRPNHMLASPGMSVPRSYVWAGMENSSLTTHYVDIAEVDPTDSLNTAAYSTYGIPIMADVPLMNALADTDMAIGVPGGGWTPVTVTYGSNSFNIACPTCNFWWHASSNGPSNQIVMQFMCPAIPAFWGAVGGEAQEWTMNSWTDATHAVFGDYHGNSYSLGKAALQACQAANQQIYMESAADIAGGSPSVASVMAIDPRSMPQQAQLYRSNLFKRITIQASNGDFPVAWISWWDVSCDERGVGYGEQHCFGVFDTGDNLINGLSNGSGGFLNSQGFAVGSASNGSGGVEHSYHDFTGGVAQTNNDADAWLANLVDTAPPPSTANLAQYGGAVASCSSDSRVNPPRNVTDSLYTTHWSSCANDASWIYVDLASPRSVSKVIIEWAPQDFGVTYALQTSNDASTWTTVKSVTGGAGGVDTETFTPTAARYVCMLGTLSSTANAGYEILEFQVYQ